MTEDSPAPAPSPKIDTTVPHSARIWNYWLGGKDNYPVDRQAGDKYREIYPQIVDTARAVRYFMARTVRYLAGEARIRQFLDVGTGLPAVDNTHEIAQRAAPECRIVYVDNDPLVLAHARALLTSSAEGTCDYVDADMRNPGAILTAAARTLDLTQPVALLLMGVMGHISDYGEARRIVGDLLGGLPAGSYLALADSLSSGPAHREAGNRYAQTGAVPYQLRTPGQIKDFFTGLTLVDPGVVPVPEWRPDPSPFPLAHVDTLGGVGRKSLQAVETAWTGAVCSLGGNRQVAAAAATDLAARYAESHRHYHNNAHVQAVLRDAAILAGELHLSAEECAVLTVAAGAHDVVYDGHPGDDERRSASWARNWLTRAGVGETHVARVEELVLATMTHSASSDDLTASVLLDADLAILGAEPGIYDRYCVAVREEYAALDEPAWRTGRAAVMSELLARDPLYGTGAARRRWEAMAKANIARELDSLVLCEERGTMLWVRGLSA